MKRTISFLLVILLCGLLAMPTLAAPEGPVITMQPQNPNYPQYSVAIYTVKATGSNLSATWYIEWEGKTYNASQIGGTMQPWEAYAGESYGARKIDNNTFSFVFEGIEDEMNGASIWCVIEDGHYDVQSAKAMITVQGSNMPPEILSIPAAVTAYRGDSVDIRCVAKSPGGTQLEYTWYETSTGRLQDIRAIMPEETGDYMFVGTESVGVRYYVCGITTSEGGRAYSSVVPVTILDADLGYNPDMEILTKTLPEATVGQPYKAELRCNDPYGLFTLYYNPGHANELEASGLRLTKENFIEGTPNKAGTFTFSVCASGDYGEDYWEYTLTVKEADVPAEVTEPEQTESVIPTETPTEGTITPTEGASVPSDGTDASTDGASSPSTQASSGFLNLNLKTAGGIALLVLFIVLGLLISIALIVLVVIIIVIVKKKKAKKAKNEEE